jgi:hypothetical protein
MGKTDEMQPAQIVGAVRNALAPYGTRVVDLTPELLKHGGDCLGGFDEGAALYVLPNTKAVRKKMGRDGASMAKGSPRQKFEERSDSGARCLLAFFTVRKGKLISSYVPPGLALADACECLKNMVGENITCAICLAPLFGKPGVRFECGHWLHCACFEKWGVTKFLDGDDVSCPTCRATIASRPEKLPW